MRNGSWSEAIFMLIKIIIVIFIFIYEGTFHCRSGFRVLSWEMILFSIFSFSAISIAEGVISDRKKKKKEDDIGRKNKKRRKKKNR